jgi:hypothetical protein
VGISRTVGGHAVLSLVTRSAQGPCRHLWLSVRGPWPRGLGEQRSSVGRATVSHPDDVKLTATTAPPYPHLERETAGLRAKQRQELLAAGHRERPDWPSLTVDGPEETADARGRARFQYRATLTPEACSRSSRGQPADGRVCEGSSHCPPDSHDRPDHCWQNPLAAPRSPVLIGPWHI